MKKILFIEDEIQLQKAFREMFISEGFDIVSAYDGDSGFEMAKKEKPDLILLDLILPKKDGFEVLESIKSDLDISETPVIILTNVEDKSGIERVLSLGAHTYLIKADYTPREVMEKVRGYFLSP